MAGPSAGFPSAPFVGPDGNVTPVWRAFLLALWTRTGAAAGTSSSDLAAALATETTARAAADATLGGAVTAEADARTTAIAVEALARKSADIALIASLGTFVFNQEVGATSWVIDHWLGRFPAVAVVDSTGTLIEGDVVYTSADQVTLGFASAFAGVAYLN